MDIGQLLGVIVAYKDLPAVRGLIDHDQKRLNVEARYSQIVEQFTQDEILEEELQQLPTKRPPEFLKAMIFPDWNLQDSSVLSLLKGQVRELNR